MSFNRKNSSLVAFKSYTEERGTLIPVDLHSDLPFKVDSVRCAKGFDSEFFNHGCSSRRIFIPLRGCFNVLSGKKLLERLFNPAQGYIISSDSDIQIESISQDNVALYLYGEDIVQSIKEIDGEGCRRYTIEDCEAIAIPMHQVDLINDFPFAVRRIFYIYDVPSAAVRGLHSHCSYHEVLVAVRGSFDVEVDDGSSRKIIKMENSSVGLYLPPGIWAKQMNFSEDVCCLVFASGKYEREGYINSYEEFLKYRSDENLLI